MNCPRFVNWAAALAGSVMAAFLVFLAVTTDRDFRVVAPELLAATPEPVFAIARYVGSGEVLECEYVDWKPVVELASDVAASTRLVPERRIETINLRSWEVYDSTGKQLTRAETSARLRSENLVLIGRDRRIVEEFYRQFMNNLVLIVVPPTEPVTDSEVPALLDLAPIAPCRQDGSPIASHAQQ